MHAALFEVERVLPGQLLMLRNCGFGHDLEGRKELVNELFCLWEVSGEKLPRASILFCVAVSFCTEPFKKNPVGLSSKVSMPLANWTLWGRMVAQEDPTTIAHRVTVSC